MAMPPRDPYYRRGWGYMNRPRPGCGCLYFILMAIFWYFIFSLLFSALRFY